MKILKSIKISTKLITLMVVMVLGILAIGLIGNYYNEKSHVAMENIYNKNLISIEMLSDARTQSRANFANLLNLITTTDPDKKEEIKTNIQTRIDSMAEDFAVYEQTGLDDYEAIQYELIKTNIAGWNDVLNEFIVMSDAGKDEEAFVYFETVGEPYFESLQTFIRDLVKYNIDSANSVYEMNEVNANKSKVLLLTSIVIVAIICCAFGFVIIRAITKPISNLVVLIKKTAELDLVYDDSYASMLDNKDELGTILNAVAELRVSLRNTTGKLTHISENLAKHSEKMTLSTDEITKTNGQVALAIGEIAAGNGTQAEMTTKTSTALMEVNKSINVVNQETTLSVENVKNSLATIAEGQETINQSIRKMQDNIDIVEKVRISMNELSEKMNKVGNITDVINEIASETNLLALNAAIEAARAGEAGKGFAVVADAIRKLAEGSSTAVNEIAEIVKEADEKNKHAAENIEKAKQIVMEQEKSTRITKEAFAKIKVAVEDIAEKTNNTANMIHTIDKASKSILDQTQDMAAIAQEAAASSEEISASSEEQLASMELISNSANELSVMAGELYEEISKFKL